MESINCGFYYDCYRDSGELPSGDKSLLERARDATKTAYAPYSCFKVGAALRLSGGIVICGSNQENASFPAGLCAERVALATAASQHPNSAVEALAISYDHPKNKSTHPISPCGICRQSLTEYEQRFGRPIRLILSGLEGKVYVIASAAALLPLSFSASDMS
jgi:cytidine deaminase